jgi:tRNA (cmo5U34)-methyltransferase
MTVPENSPPKEVRDGLDHDLEGILDPLTQLAAIPDCAVMMETAARAAAALNPEALNVLDIRCGEGSGSLNLLQKIPGLQFTLVDVRSPILEKAEERLQRAGAAGVATLQGDIRKIPIAEDQFDIVIAVAALHHLRSEEEWMFILEKMYRSMKLGGSVWIINVAAHNQPEIQQAEWKMYGEFLSELKGEAYRDEVLTWVEKRASPLPLNLQLRYLQQSGFSTEVLHKRMCFAAFGGVKVW